MRTFNDFLMCLFGVQSAPIMMVGAETTFVGIGMYTCIRFNHTILGSSHFLRLKFYVLHSYVRTFGLFPNFNYSSANVLDAISHPHFVWSKVGVDNPIGDRWSSGPRSNGANSVRKDLCQICVPTVFVLNRGLGGGAAGAKPTYRLLAILPEPEFFFIWTAFLDFGWLKRAELVW